jgi:hypothetical protein
MNLNVGSLESSRFMSASAAEVDTTPVPKKRLKRHGRRKLNPIILVRTKRKIGRSIDRNIKGYDYCCVYDWGTLYIVPRSAIKAKKFHSKILAVLVVLGMYLFVVYL